MKPKKFAALIQGKLPGSKITVTAVADDHISLEVQRGTRIDHHIVMCDNDPPYYDLDAEYAELIAQKIMRGVEPRTETVESPALPMTQTA